MHMIVFTKTSVILFYQVLTLSVRRFLCYGKLKYVIPNLGNNLSNGSYRYGYKGRPSVYRTEPKILKSRQKYQNPNICNVTKVQTKAEYHFADRTALINEGTFLNLIYP